MIEKRAKKEEKKQLHSLLCRKVLLHNGAHAEEWRAQNC